MAPHSAHKCCWRAYALVENYTLLLISHRPSLLNNRWGHEFDSPIDSSMMLNPKLFIKPFIQTERSFDDHR